MARSGFTGVQNIVVFFVSCSRRYCKTLKNTSLRSLSMAFHDGKEENSLLRPNLKSHCSSLLLKLHFQPFTPARPFPDNASRTNASSIIWSMLSSSPRTKRMAETSTTTLLGGFIIRELPLKSKKENHGEMQYCRAKCMDRHKVLKLDEHQYFVSIQKLFIEARTYHPYTC